MSPSDFECSLDPCTCEYSCFNEWDKENDGNIIRWIECVESYQDEEGNWHEKDQGFVCKHNPRDWQEVYNEDNKK